jgi:sirohydrochlorin cobaltochelatase
VNTVVVLAMHGVPPRDFPAPELAEFFGLHARIEAGGHGMAPALTQRYRDLEGRLRAWPRTPANDPFHAASMDLAARLARDTGLEVIVGFNEFCGPSLDEAFVSAAARGAGRVVVITSMLTQGGEHAERDIPAAIACARRTRPGVEFVYAWPFEDSAVLRLLAEQVRRFAGRCSGPP